MRPGPKHLLQRPDHAARLALLRAVLMLGRRRVLHQHRRGQERESKKRGGAEDGLSSCYFGPTSTPKKTTHPFFRPSFSLSFSLEFIQSIQNCGSCGAACSADVAVSCCSGACTNLATSGANCGACGAACLGGSTCQGGTCLCPSGTTFSADGKSCLVPPGKTVSPDGSVVTCPSDAW